MRKLHPSLHSSPHTLTICLVAPATLTSETATSLATPVLCTWISLSSRCQWLNLYLTEIRQLLSQEQEGLVGAIFMIGTFYAYITIIDCQFIQNNSPFLGGAIFALSFSYSHSIANCIFDGNQAAVSGGSLALVDGSFEVNSSTFINSVAGSEGGGGITCRDCVRLSVTNTSLANNTCEEAGGAIKVSGLPASDVILDQINATGNM
jgi:predicted outer membrane repeat protein